MAKFITPADYISIDGRKNHNRFAIRRIMVARDSVWCQTRGKEKNWWRFYHSILAPTNCSSVFSLSTQKSLCLPGQFCEYRKLRTITNNRTDSGLLVRKYVDQRAVYSSHLIYELCFAWQFASDSYFPCNLFE